MPRSIAAATRGLGVLVAALLLWQLLYATNVLTHVAFSSATSALSALVTMLGTGLFWSELGFTFEAWAVGLAIGIGIGVVIGGVIGLSSFAYESLNLVIEFMKAIPAIAVLPIVILIFGITLKMNIALVVIGVTWPVMIQTAYGVRSVEPVVRETAAVYRMGRLDQLRNVVFPSAAPYLATGLRLASTGALLLVVVAELIGGGGIGYAIYLAQNSGGFAQMYALIIAIGLLGIGLNFLNRRLERRTLRWHISQRPAV
jgi:ABC-type nitrate/sulfonate/bicarbonate transport system permease component